MVTGKIKLWVVTRSIVLEHNTDEIARDNFKPVKLKLKKNDLALVEALWQTKTVDEKQE